MIDECLKVCQIDK